MLSPVRLALACLGAVLFFGPSVRAAEPRWNLLLITADDLNADSPGWMGNPLKATPRLDAFAATGHRFLNHHVTAPICQPSREALMTGRVPHRNGGLGFNPVNPDVPTLVEVLRATGYYTAALNKIPHMAPAGKFPWDHAFDGSGKDPALMRTQMDEALAEAKAAGKPFFINANLTDPHRPFYQSQQGAEKLAKAGTAKAKKAARKAGEGVVTPFRPEEVPVPAFLEDIPRVRQEVAQYYSSIRRLDLGVGGILDALDAAGRREDTIVVFLSDHGMSFPFSKASVYFNGTWSPVVLRYPGMGPPQVREEFVSSVDLMPTLLELLRVPSPAGMDGRSWLPLLAGRPQPGRDHVITHVNTVSSGKSLPQRCVRTKDWAFLFHAWADGQTSFRVEAMNGLAYNALAEAGRTNAAIQRRVEQFVRGEPLMLFDERLNREERVNLIDDPRYRGEAERLAGLLLAHMEKTADPQLAGFQAALAAWRRRAPAGPP